MILIVWCLLTPKYINMYVFIYKQEHLAVWCPLTPKYINMYAFIYKQEHFLSYCINFKIRKLTSLHQQGLNPQIHSNLFSWVTNGFDRTRPWAKARATVLVTSFQSALPVSQWAFPWCSQPSCFWRLHFSYYVHVFSWVCVMFPHG